MKNKKQAFGSMNSQGGILISVLLAVFLCSLLLLNVLTAYHQTADLVVRTKNLYEARIAKELFLADYPNLKEKEGSWFFNKGEITYQNEGKEVKITVKIKNKKYHFYEKNSTSISSE
ncbi:competence type IV pilus minor pilin ComGG [Enterococcus hermanniensis]